jgi:hypothetical protein
MHKTKAEKRAERREKRTGRDFVSFKKPLENRSARTRLAASKSEDAAMNEVMETLTESKALKFLFDRQRCGLTIPQLALQWGWDEPRVTRRLEEWEAKGAIYRDGGCIEAGAVARPLPPPLLAIPKATRRLIIFGALALIGAVALAVTIVSLNDMAEGFQQALNLATWKAWILALLADILFIGVELLCIFAPAEIVAKWVTRAIRCGAIGISMASNAFSLAWIAPIPFVGVIAGIVMPLAIAGCTYTIGYAVHKGGRDGVLGDRR